MKIDDETFSAIVTGWTVMVVIILCVLLPFAVNVPTLPAGAYKVVSGQFPGLTRPDSHLTSFVPREPGGLLVWYDFEEEIGQTLWIPDASGNGNNAYVKGVFVRSGPGIAGGHSVFLPGTGLLWCPVNPAAGRTNITFSLWFTGGSIAGNNYEIAGAVAGTEPRTGWTLGTRVSELWDDDGNAIRTQAASPPADDLPSAGWNHKALVYNGTHVTEYLNGAPVNVYAASGMPVGGGEEVMTIGSWRPFGQNYAGQVDEFRIYDRALRPDELAALYREGSRS
ncbi:MAG: hypothetical protein A4E35_01969 [Methanoregula sp. PtaU1.Bin051]|nr:MAG: hypothetical protein A4E35_01969 [Methanoregula sp. PtaU1.Bin051]